MNIQHELFQMQDPDYKAFHSRLIPTVNPDLIIGVRTPVLRKFAKAIKNTPEANSFLNTLPHKYYEENNLHAFLIEEIKDFDEALFKTDKFLPYIDNWATCDMFLPKVFRKNTDKLTDKIYEWMNSNETYTLRYAIGLLLSLYLDDKFKCEYADAVAKIRHDEYYVNMMIAWYFSTALSKQYECILPYLLDGKLPVWVHNKTIQKAIESKRIDKDIKAYLKTLKIKE